MEKTVLLKKMTDLLKKMTVLLMEKLVNIRRHLHSIAETAHKESRTARYIADKLKDMAKIREGIGGHGIIATIDSGRQGPVLLFRAELDALPIDETIDLPHASKTRDVAHKCGHDGHMAILMGLACKLQEKPLKRGKVHLLFQPAEETGEGAQRMLEDPEMQDIRPDLVFALHNLPGFPEKAVILREDVFAAGSAGLIVRLTGNTAHAAHPEQGRSPASAVAALIQNWEALPGKVLESGRFGLLTIIHARIGSPAFGTTPGYAELMATLRASEPEDLASLRKEAVATAEREAKRYHLKMNHEWTEVFHPTVNHGHAVKLAEKAASKLAGRGLLDKQHIMHIPDPFPWSEDFGCFTGKYPGALFGLGAGTEHPHLHDTHYDFPDGLLSTGVMLFFGIIEETGLF